MAGPRGDFPGAIPWIHPKSQGKGEASMYEKGRRSGLCVGVLLLSLLVFSASAEARTYHVTQNGGGDKGGGDWSNALDEGGFRNKLKESETDDVFWVAKGIYRPSGKKN